MNYAYLSQIKIDTENALPMYAQLRDGFRDLIINGVLPGGNKIPSSRILSTHFGIHRQTIVTAMDELVAEGWLVSKERKGLFVNDRLPEIRPRSFGTKTKSYPMAPAYKFRTVQHPATPQRNYLFGFDDGYPDIRIAPYASLGKAYVQALNENTHRNTVAKLSSASGSKLLRSELAGNMSAYRGLAISADNILLTHGSQMSIFLVASMLIAKGDNVAVTRPNYLTSNNCFLAMGANLVEVGVDENGMDVAQLEAACKKRKIVCVYVTSHHHHPTTVTLSIERRLQLLQLAERYGFAIIEDDYDYDFHYQNKPLLPIASNDKRGSVIYIGSFSKILSHAFRVGYIIAPQEFIKQVSTFRRLVDRQGDPVLEEAIGKLFRQNIIKSHVRKAVNTYKERRDITYGLLQNELRDYMQCTLPEGGLAFWAHFDRRIGFEKLSERCAAKGLFFPNGNTYNYDKAKLNACRMGFASMNTNEAEKAVDILKTEIKKLSTRL